MKTAIKGMSDNRALMAFQVFSDLVVLGFSAFTIWQIIEMGKLPASKAPSIPISKNAKFRHGDLQKQTVQLQIDDTVQRHEMQVFLILIVSFYAPIRLGYLFMNWKHFRHGSKYALSGWTKKTYEQFEQV